MGTHSPLSTSNAYCNSAEKKKEQRRGIGNVNAKASSRCFRTPTRQEHGLSIGCCPIEAEKTRSRHVAHPLRLDRVFERYVSVHGAFVQCRRSSKRGAGGPHAQQVSPTAIHTRRKRQPKEQEGLPPPRRRPHGAPAAPAARTIVVGVGSRSTIKGSCFFIWRTRPRIMFSVGPVRQARLR